MTSDLSEVYGRLCAPMPTFEKQGLDWVPPDQFVALIEVQDGTDACWEWRGPRVRGYGRFAARKQVEYAHRLTWRIVHGDVPKGLHVLHNCPGGDNPACVNPGHLWLGTQRENNADRDRKGRSRPVSGEQHGRARLTALQVADIRSRWKPWRVTAPMLAREYGVTEWHILDIVHGRVWRTA